MTPRLLRPATLLATCALLTLAWQTAPGESARDQESTATAETLVRELYDQVTFGPGESPDWERVREMFMPEAVIVLRTSRTEHTVFDVSGWIDDFVAFIERANVTETGFAETIARTSSTTTRDIAHVWVVYDAHVPGQDRPPTRGVDGFQLVRLDGTWRIASIINDIPNAEHPLPRELSEER